VGFIIASILSNKLVNRSILENQIIEIVWTLLPSVILLFIAFPSLRLLYLLDEVLDPALTLKTIGHQWYWSYEYSDFHRVSFDAYIVKTNELNPGMFRLLEADHHSVIPTFRQIRILATAEDVIHAWTVPSLGVKADAVPGRLNQLRFLVSRVGFFYGQCSEICGANHRFIPIVLEVIPIKYFLEWVSKFD